MKIKILITSFLIFICNGAFTQEYNLEKITKIIAKDHPILQMDDFHILMYDTLATGAKAWEPPLVEVGLNMVPYVYEKDMGSLMFSVTQMIPNPSKLKANEKYMYGMSGVEREHQKYLCNQLISQAKMAYYEWIVLKKRKAVLLDSENLMKYIVETAEASYTVKNVKLNSIYKAKAELAQLKSMLVMIENEIEQKRIMLNTVMNRDKKIVFEIEDVYVIKNYEDDLIEPNQINEFRSDLKVIDQNIQVAQLKQKFEKSQRLPDFGVKFQHSDSFGDQPNQYSASIMMTLPMVPWSSKMYKAKVKGIEYEIQAMQKEKLAMANEVAGMIIGLQVEIKNKKTQVKLYQDEIVPALQKNYKISLLAYEQNTEELFMVLDAWQMLKMKQLESLNELQELLLKQVAYEKEKEIIK